MKWISAGLGKHGLKYREHETETIGLGKNIRPVRYYKTVVKIDGQAVSDVFGWETEVDGGYHQIERLALQFKMNRKAKTPPYTYREFLETRVREQEVIKEESRKEEESVARILFGNVFREYISFQPDKRSTRDMVGFYKKWLADSLENKPLDQIALMDLQKIQQRMEKAGRAPRTVKTIKEVVRQVYSFASSHEIYDGVKPTTNFLKSQKLNNQRAEYYSRAQADELLQVLSKRSTQTYRMALLSLSTGMRFGEIASLLWQHINTERRVIVIIDPKNSDNRVVYMVQDVVDMFTEMSAGTPDSLVFPDKNGEVMGKISNTFPKTVKDLGFNEGVTDRRLKLGFHSLRHTAASWLANQGVEMQVIAKVLGHKTLAMTMRYSHINDTTVKDAMALLENASSGKH